MPKPGRKKSLPLVMLTLEEVVTRLHRDCREGRGGWAGKVQGGAASRPRIVGDGPRLVRSLS